MAKMMKAAKAKGGKKMMGMVSAKKKGSMKSASARVVKYK
jgi:hypothetical protein